MTPQEFADMLRRVADLHERSWANGKYTLTLRECCNEHCPPPWEDIVYILLISEYSEMWDWCNKVDPQD